MTYDEAIAKLRQLDRVRNGETEAEYNDPDEVVVPILDEMPEILAALDPSRDVKSPQVPTEHEDLLTQVAGAMWRVAWDACNMFNERREQDLYQGDPVAMVVKQVLDARTGHPLPFEFERTFREFAFGPNDDEKFAVVLANATPAQMRESARSLMRMVLTQLDYERARAAGLAEEARVLRAESQRSLLVERAQRAERRLVGAEKRGARWAVDSSVDRWPGTQRVMDAVEPGPVGRDAVADEICREGRERDGEVR